MCYNIGHFDVIIYYFNGAMSKVCFFCEKRVKAGGHRRHKYGGGWEYRSPRTTRKFKPNLRSVVVEKDEKEQKVDICMKCYKKMRKEEGKK